jgi:copper chaperone
MSQAESVYTVSGMTCEHCKRSVMSEVLNVPGAEAVDVDLASGRLTVAGDAAATDVASAVREAGYELTP